jgi:succinate dehydrogenase/fumarate reductase flavoprotein subunit
MERLRTDCCVVGAGFAGLAAARRLRERTKSVAASHLNASNRSSNDTLISDPDKSVTDATPLFVHTG